VNRFVDEEPGPPVETHRVALETEARKVRELRRIKAARDGADVQRALDELVRVATDPAADLMPATIAAVKARATMGEIVNALKVPFGTYRETPVF
jgi:methylmalonyl-CoA mutase N-terminal domain/subunit